jgi:very-short-patch-repair endonuclease
LGGDIGGETPGGAGDMGGGAGGAPGADAGGGAGGAGGAGGGTMASSSVANIREFGGKVLKKKSREKISKYKEKLFKHKQDDASGYMRDDKGRIMLTGPERELLREVAKSVRRGEMRHAIQSQFPVKAGSQEYSIDFAMPDIKLGIEVDGALFHSTDDQKASDRRRDSRLAQQGWTILRFTDKEVENKTHQVIETIIKHQIQKENWMKQNQGR